MNSQTDDERLQRRPASRHIKLAFVGDICLGGGLQERLRRDGGDYPFAAARSATEGADLVIGNLECCIVDSPGDVEPAHNVMIVPSTLANGLLTAGIDVVALSNNHILDGGAAGLESTWRFLDAHRIRHFGAGRTLMDAEGATFLEHNGVRLAFLGACDAPTVYATHDSHGVPPMQLASLRRRIIVCRRHADIVIVSLHADLEFSSYPAPTRVRLSRNLIDAGADLVIQHHPHVCQGVETYRHGLIAYSLGNFVFRVAGNNYLSSQKGTDWGVVLHVDIILRGDDKSISYSPRFISIDENNRSVCSTGESLNDQMKQLQQYSLGLQNPAKLRRERILRCRAEARMNVYGFYYRWRRNGIIAAFKAIWRILSSPYERRWIYSLLSFGRL